VDSHLRLLAHAGAVDGSRAATAMAAFDEVTGALRAPCLAPASEWP
jgi:hypothetical protein